MIWNMMDEGRSIERTSCKRWSCELKRNSLETAKHFSIWWPETGLKVPTTHRSELTRSEVDRGVAPEVARCS